MSIFRALFPSWKFFVATEHFFRLHLRFAMRGGPMGEWIEGLSIPPRRWIGLLVNADTNFLLASHSLIENLVNESQHVADPQTLEQLTSYQLVKELVRHQVPPATDRFQFKISLWGQGLPVEDSVVMSKEYPL